MDPSDIRIEDVLQKWERYHPPSALEKTDDEKPWYHQPLPDNASATNPRRRTRRNVAKTADQALAAAVMGPKRFRIVPPVLDVDINNYVISQCVKCQATLNYQPALSKTHLKSQTMSLFDCIGAGMSLAQRFGFCFVQNIVSGSCYQSTDARLLRDINKKPTPVLVVCEAEEGSFSTLLLQMFMRVLGKQPLSVARESTVTSPLLKYLMKMFGFLIVEDNCSVDFVAGKLVEALRNNMQVVVCMPEGPATSQKHLFAVLNRLRNDQTLQNRTLLMSTSISMEKEVCFENKSSSWWETVRDWLFSPPQRCGLVHFNISRTLNIQSLFRLADEMNHQEVKDEENALMQRHIAFDLLETGAILPTHLLSFLFVTKFRNGVAYDKLKESVDWLLRELRSMKRFVGFTGNIDDVVRHGLDLLVEDGTVEMDATSNWINVHTKSCTVLHKLFTCAKKILNVYIVQAVTAVSIIACVGGRTEMHQGSGYNVTCKNTAILEKAEMLSYMLSFLFDFQCPLNDMTDVLSDCIETMVTQDVLQVHTDIYESQTHQKLVHNIVMDAGWEDEDEDQHGMGTTTTNSVEYAVSVHDEDIMKHLKFLSTCVNPFLEVCFNVLALVRENYAEGKEFTATAIHELLVTRFESGLCVYGELVCLNTVTRVLEYMFEKMIIDDVEDRFLLSEGFDGTGEMEILLGDIALFR